MPLFSASESASARQPPLPRTGLNRAIRVLLVLTISVNLVYLVALLLPGDPASTFVNVGLSITAQWAPVGVFWLVAVRTGFSRPEVILAAAGVSFNAAGDTFYSFSMNSSGEFASPSLADVGYLLYYPLTLAALLVLVARQSRGSIKSAFFDGAVASLGAASVLIVVLGPVFTDVTRGTTPVDGAVAVLYPLFDVLLVTTAIAIFASPALRLGPRWQFLALGFLLFIGADITYALLTHDGAYVTGTPLDAAWPGGIALTAFWVDGVTRLEPGSRATRSNARVLPIPALAVFAGLGVLLIADRSTVPPLALVLAAATITLAALSVMSRHAALARLLEGQENLVQRLKEIDKQKSYMIQTMSHEMRTPLTSILGHLDLLLDDDAAVPGNTKVKLQVVERNARRLFDLARNMLLLARLESRNTPPRVVSFDISQTLRRVEESLRPLADCRKVRLEISGEVTTIVEADQGQLEQALRNVVENAVKFTPVSGLVNLDVRSSSAPDGSKRVTISVTDNGMGIPAEEVPHVFDRFFRATNAQDEAVQGTGLGLAIVREIAHAHGGDVSVSSVLGEGTAVRITLPTHQSSAGSLARSVYRRPGAVGHPSRDRR